MQATSRILVQKVGMLFEIGNQPGAVTCARFRGAQRIEFQRHILQREGLEIECSAREFALLRYLVERRGQVVSRDTLLEVVWGRPQEVSTRTVDNFVVRLRRKIEVDPAHPRVLLTVHGAGYKLVAD